MSNKYILHNTAIINFLSWLQTRDRYKETRIKDEVIYLPSIVSRRFGIGVPKKKQFGKNIFLGFQSEELFWASNILWKEAVLQCYNPHLYLVSKKIIVPGMPTSPSFAVAIPFDNPKKAYSCAEAKKLDIRGIWFDDKGRCVVEKNEPRGRMKIREWDGKLFEKDDLKMDVRIEDIVKNKIGKSNIWSDPGYKGEKTQLSDPQLQNIMKDN